MSALIYCSPSTIVRAQLLFALSYWMPSATVCPQLLIKYTMDAFGEYTRSIIHRSKRSTPLHTPLVHLALTFLTRTSHPVPARQLYCCTPIATTPHTPFNIQDGRCNARCAALSTWGERTQPAVATAWLELLT